MNDFVDIVGHKSIISHLQNAIRMKKVSHAYIIEGEEGMGKKLVAAAFSKTLQCEAGGSSPCNTCTSCRLFDSNNHPDVKHIISEKKMGLGVDEVREEINTNIYIKPYQYPYKIYIIHEADLMTIQSQNALLKTMEEPPEYGVLLFLAENSSRFLPTVLSRCVLLGLKELDEKTIQEYLKKTEELSEEEASLYASFARGNIGKAKMLLNSEEFDKMRKDIIDAMNIVTQEDDLELLSAAEILASYKDQGGILFDLLITWLRDLLIIKEIGTEKFIIHKDMYKTLLKQAQLMSYNRISKMIEKTEQAIRNMRVNVNYQLSIEIILLNID